MALSVMINLDDMLFAAYNLGAEISETTPRLSKEELRAKLLADVPLIASTNERPTKPAKKTKTSQAEQQVDETSADETETEKPETADKPKTEKKPKAAAAADKPKAEKKPKAEPEGDVRCCARSLYEKDHIEAGKPKAMRDDEANLYGDRCKFKKVGETEFCKHHAEKQPLGVWGAEYAGKFHALVQKLNAPVEDKPKAAKEDKPKTEKPAKKSKVAAEVCELTEEEPSTPAVEKPKAAKVEQPKAAPAATKPVAPEPAEDEEVAEVEECEIDGKTYLRDNEGTIYDMESEEEVGQYNFNTKKWIKRA